MPHTNHAETVFKCHPYSSFVRSTKMQELLSELPNDTCPIPEPLEVPAIPEGEDRIDSAETPPASAIIGKSDMDGLEQTANFSDADQTRVHAGRDRSACHALQPVLCLCTPQRGGQYRQLFYQRPSLSTRDSKLRTNAMAWVDLRLLYPIKGDCPLWQRLAAQHLVPRSVRSVGGSFSDAC